MRFCNKCYICKDESEFASTASIKSNYLKYTCKSCERIFKKDYQGVVYYNKPSSLGKTYKIKETTIRIKHIKYADLSQEEREKIRIKGREYYRKNRVKIIAREKRLRKKAREQNPLIKIKKSISRVTIVALKKRQKYSTRKKRMALLGAPVEIVKKHIERQFKKGMTWENHGKHGWHIDHIIPLASAKTEEDLFKLFHYTNLQPLWAYDNLSKGGKIPQVQTKLAI